MTNKAKDYRALVLTSVNNYQCQILQEFLLLADELKSELVRFCEAGVDLDKRIAFKEYAPENARHKSFIIVDEQKVRVILNILSSINKSNACVMYKRFTANLPVSYFEFLNRFSVFAELDEMYTTCRYVQKALELLSFEEE